MASRFYGLDRGQPGQTFVTEAAATTGLDIEVVVDRAAGWNKKEALIALERIKEHILTMPSNTLIE
jgi:hypothetical protein